MATRNEKTYTSQERLAQLRLAESLHDAGLYKSAQLITGIHLSTVRKDEKWFQANAMYQYARSLTKLEEHRRATEYYMWASHIEDIAVPLDLLKTRPSMSDSGTAPVTDISTVSDAATTTAAATATSRPMTRGMELFNALHAGKEEMKKDRDNRGLLMDTLIATARSSIAKPNLRESAKSTKTMLPSIPPVKPLSVTISKQRQQQSQLSSDDDHTRKKQHLSVDQPSTTTPLRASGKASSAGSVTPITGLSREPLMQDLNDLKMDFALSCYESGDYIRAKELLLQIPEDKRTVRTYLLLIQLLHKKTSLQIREDTYWSEIAKLQPLALEAYVHMLRAGTPLFFVSNMIPKDSPEYEWMKLYLQGLDSFFHMRYEAAHQTFTILDGMFPHNTDIKIRLALCLRWMGNPVRACLIFSQVRREDLYVIDDLYHYAECLKELYNAKLINKSDHCGALQLRGLIYLESSPVRALGSFREASKTEKDLVTYEGMVKAYILLERHLEACKEAEEAKVRMPGNAQALALYGTALYHAANDEVAQDAQDQVNEALRIDPSCKLAAHTLLLIYENQRRFEEAIDLLDQQLDHQPPDEIHIKKAEIYSSMERWEDALSSYERARSFNPLNVIAREGIANVEKILSGGDDELDDEQDLDDELEIDEMDVHQDESPHLREQQLDEDDILTGEEDHGEEYEDGHLGHRMQSPQFTPHQPQRNGSLFAARARALAQQPQEERFHNRQQPMPEQTPNVNNRVLDTSLFTPRQGQQQYVSPPQQQQQLQHQLHRLQQEQHRQRHQQHQEQQHRYGAHRQQQDNMPSSSGYPQTPSRSMVSPTSYAAHHRRLNSQREREYDEQEDMDDDMIVIKRIVALEGDVVQTRSPYPEAHVRVPRGHCWVEGDEMFHSRDSNHYGPVPLGLVKSKVEYVLYPLNRFGKIPDKPRGNRVRYAPGHKVYNRLDHE
ncbi:Anaphase-promoting complex subunit 7 [Linnemannia hyalina]|uniref:Mitochondrial inner membrane protease subunit 2 n=1 Tax=Linnemannia hyalina TaxID=64524 RepID=A0A9P7Y399_9FUNG|nr:Anaphase-promoting complex subunit 7 [Linnemannia hyalina]